MAGPATWGSINLGGTIGTLHAGAPLRLAHWPGAANGPGTVILVHGRGEYIEVYGETIADFCQRGFAVITYDHRGQGASKRARRRGGHIGDYKTYADDLVSVVRYAAQLDLPRPFFVVAHSMGGLVALTAAPRLVDDVSRMVLLAPVLRIAQLPVPAPLVVALGAVAGVLGLDRLRVGPVDAPPTPFKHNQITSDPARYKTLLGLAEANPELAVGPPTLGWVRATINAGRRIQRQIGLPLPVPSLFVASGRDEIVSTPLIDRFARSAPGSGAVMIPDARHQVLLERDELRDLAFAAMDAFILNIAPARTKAGAKSTGKGAAATRRPARRGRALRFEAAAGSNAAPPPVTARARPPVAETVRPVAPAKPAPAVAPMAATPSTPAPANAAKPAAPPKPNAPARPTTDGPKVPKRTAPTMARPATDTAPPQPAVTPAPVAAAAPPSRTALPAASAPVAPQPGMKQRETGKPEAPKPVDAATTGPDASPKTAVPRQDAVSREAAAPAPATSSKAPLSAETPPRTPSPPASGEGIPAATFKAGSERLRKRILARKGLAAADKTPLPEPGRIAAKAPPKEPPKPEPHAPKDRGAAPKPQPSVEELVAAAQRVVADTAGKPPAQAGAEAETRKSEAPRPSAATPSTPSSGATGPAGKTASPKLEESTATQADGTAATSGRSASTPEATETGAATPASEKPKGDSARPAPPLDPAVEKRRAAARALRRQKAQAKQDPEVSTAARVQAPAPDEQRPATAADRNAAPKAAPVQSPPARPANAGPDPTAPHAAERPPVAARTAPPPLAGQPSAAAGGMGTSTGASMSGAAASRRTPPERQPAAETPPPAEPVGPRPQDSAPKAKPSEAAPPPRAAEAGPKRTAPALGTTGVGSSAARTPAGAAAAPPSAAEPSPHATGTPTRRAGAAPDGAQTAAPSSESSGTAEPSAPRAQGAGPKAPAPRSAPPAPAPRAATGGPASVPPAYAPKAPAPAPAVAAPPPTEPSRPSGTPAPASATPSPASARPTAEDKSHAAPQPGPESGAGVPPQGPLEAEPAPAEPPEHPSVQAPETSVPPPPPAVDEAPPLAPARPAPPEVASVRGTFDAGRAQPPGFVEEPRVSSTDVPTSYGDPTVGTAMDESVPIRGGEFAVDSMPEGFGDFDDDHGLFSTDWLSTHHAIEPEPAPSQSGASTVWVPIPPRPQEPAPPSTGDAPGPAATETDETPPGEPDDDGPPGARPRGPIRPLRRVLPPRQRPPRRR